MKFKNLLFKLLLIQGLSWMAVTHGFAQDNLEVDGRTIINQNGEALRLNGVGNSLNFSSGVTQKGYLGSLGADITLMSTEGDLFLGSNNFLRMGINEIGNVGIGTTAPSEKLDVIGRTRIEQDGEALILDGFSNRMSFYTGATYNSYFAHSGGIFILSNVQNNPMHFRTDDLTRMAITGSGDVGIGISSPGSKLEVGGLTTIDTNGEALRLDGTNTSLSFYNGATYKGNLAYDQTDLALMNRESGTVEFGTNNLTRMVIQEDGTVSVGAMDTDGYQLKVVHGDFGLSLQNSNSNNNEWEFFSGDNVNGELSLYNNFILRGTFSGTTGTYTPMSDRRLKKNFTKLESVLDKVMLLEPTRYQFIHNNPRDEETIGFIAQDVENLFPEFVSKVTSTRDKGTYTLDYSGFGTLAIKAIQEQQVTIEELKVITQEQQLLIESLQTNNQQVSNEKAALEKRLNSMEEKLDGLLSQMAVNQ